MLDNYFQFYGLEESFFLNEKALKLKYLEFSKSNHPDFFINDEKNYADALSATSLNNSAYKTLSRFNKRLEYILKINGVLSESKNDIPQSFLMEMMDVNEAIMELQFDFDNEVYSKIQKETFGLQSKFEQEIKELATKADSLKDGREEVLTEIKEVYLKQKYVLRIRESLDKFAAL